MQNEPFPNTTRAAYKTLIWEAINKCGGGVDYVSENIIKQSTINKGNLCYNQRQYNTLMLIDVESLHPETAHQLLRFVEDGGKLLCIDTIPYQSLGLSGDYVGKDSIVKSCFEQIRAIKDRFVFVKPPKEGFIPWYDSLMKAEQLPHYLDIDEPDPYVMQNRYTTDDGSEMLFIVNSHRYHSHQTSITFHQELTHKKRPWIWDLHTGERYALSLNEDNSYDFDLGPAESVLIVFEKGKRNDEPADGRFASLRETKPSSIDLSNDWEVELLHARLDTLIQTHFDTLFDLKGHPDYQHFAGTIVYRKTIHGEVLGNHSGNDPTDKSFLDLGLVEGVSEVFVNGQSAGVRYYGRRIYDIGDLLQEGDNALEIRVTTTLGNYLKTLSREENPTTWIYVNHPRRDQPLQPQGLIGPVILYKMI